MLIKPIIKNGLQCPIVKDFIEIWRPVTMYPAVPNMYIVSNTGKVALTNGQLLSQYMINSGYLTVTLCKVDGTRSAFLVHRLVAYEFVPNPYNKSTVNHLQEKTLNTDYNLEWNTQQENNEHARYTGRQNISCEDNYQAKMTNAQVIKVCELLERGCTYKYILESIGMEDTPNNRDLIGNIKRGIAWKDISKDYNFNNIDYKYSYSMYSEDTIIEICQAIADDKSIKQIIEEVLNIKYTSCSGANKREYEFIRRLKNKKQYTNISDKYF